MLAKNGVPGTGAGVWILYGVHGRIPRHPSSTLVPPGIEAAGNPPVPDVSVLYGLKRGVGGADATSVETGLLSNVSLGALPSLYSLARLTGKRGPGVGEQAAATRAHFVFTQLASAKYADHVETGALRSLLQNSIHSSFEDAEADATSFRTDFGLRFDLSEGATDVFQFGATARTSFRKAFVKAPDPVYDFLRGDGETPGLVGNLIEALEGADQRLRDRYGSLGVLFSTTA